MITVELGNSYSRIKGLSVQEERELKSFLSYTVGGSSAYYSGYGIRKKSLLGKGGVFPTGLIHRLKSVSIQDKRIRPKLQGKTPLWHESCYKWQKEAAIKAFLYERGTISACTGSGKSRLIALLASMCGLRTLVVVPSLEIKRQLIESLNKDLGPNKVVVENIDSTALKTMKDFDCLIIDEAHHVSAKTYQKLNKTVWNDIYYRWFLTATPFRNDTEETILFESIAGEVIYEYSYKQAVKDSVVVPVEAFYVDLPKTKNDYYTYQEVYKNLVVNNDNRNNIILDLLLKLNTSNKSTLCLVKEVKHGANIKHPYFVNGEDESSREFIKHFNSGEIKTIVATTGILGEGVDSKPCEFVIIAGLGKAKSQFMQQIGRAVRNYPGKESAKVILFRDSSHRFTLRHFNAQKKILKEEYGCTPIKLEL